MRVRTSAHPASPAIDVNYVSPITFGVGQIGRKCKSKNKRDSFTLFYIVDWRHTRGQGCQAHNAMSVAVATPCNPHSPCPRVCLHFTISQMCLCSGREFPVSRGVGTPVW